jgi:hypothetical protein
MLEVTLEQIENGLVQGLRNEIIELNTELDELKADSLRHR